MNECICKKERGLLENPCEKPLEVCLAIASIPGLFDNPRYGRSISKEEAYDVRKDKCIGCGLCVSTCPSESIQLVRKEAEELVHPPQDEMAWFEERGRFRGVDFSAYK